MNFSKSSYAVLESINNFRSLNRIGKVRNSSYQKLSKNHEKESIGTVGWMLIAVPVTTFVLGTWQVKRKIWKENLIENMTRKTSSDPVPLTENIDNLEELEYRPVYAKGRFLHDKELYMGPRSFLKSGDSTTEGGLISQRGSSSQGYLVVTPFQLEGSDKIVLVNRGWVPMKQKNPRSRIEGQTEDTLSIVGVVRAQEHRPPFLPKNNVESNQWYYRDVETMAKVTGADPIFLELTNECDIRGGPIGGQTRVNLRNEHLSYIITWYSLSAITAFLWYSKFIRNVAFK